MKTPKTSVPEVPSKGRDYKAKILQQLVVTVQLFRCLSKLRSTRLAHLQQILDTISAMHLLEVQTGHEEKVLH